jgi:hypothetical protein
VLHGRRGVGLAVVTFELLVYRVVRRN